MKNQGKMTPQREHSNFLVIDSKELPDKEFKILVSRKINNLQGRRQTTRQNLEQNTQIK